VHAYIITISETIKFHGSYLYCDAQIENKYEGGGYLAPRVLGGALLT
jgi:hypothetical protein